ncbi:MAG TPA: chitobiase/beta-hexosaminidase C-terminal domain-containing protein, partial [Rubrobacteraceae bacterium]|nr:chitobiase/beta-hexosaminidase C-terminal domain-containing protein [Rubrobacteraceae bacterium]
PLPKAIDSAGLIGKSFNGTTITRDNLKPWVEQQVPTQGVPKNTQDASVWNWKWDDSNPAGPVALGEPEDASPWPNHPGQLWPDLADGSHPGGLPGDQFVGDRPKIMFDPVSGHPAFPLLRPHIAQRSPFAGNGHSGAPYLGASGDKAPDPNAPGGVDPYANRADGLCPSKTAGGAPTPLRNFNITSFVTPIQVTAAGDRDQTGMIFALNKDRAAIQAGNKPAQPLAIRGNMGDCIQINFNTELTDAASFGNFAKGNMHIHHVQFDIQGSDGASAGFVYDQSVRPYKAVDPQLTQAASQGDTVLHLSSVAKFQNGVWIEVGEGTDNLDVRQIASINAAANTVTLTQPLEKSHAINEWAGTEFMRYRWYPDVELDNIFWHDHVDGIHGWGKGLVSQLIVEPEGSTYHDPKTGAQVDSGTIVDIHATKPLAPGVPGSFREMALWTIDENPATDSTLNLRAEPWADRLANNGDPSLLFSSYTHGDPNTPLPKAYPGDPFVIRTINVSGGVDTLHIDGHRVFVENRYADETGKTEASPLDTIHYGISEKYTAILEGGAGGPDHRPGDYLYQNGVGRRFTQGAWGILRVLAGQSPDLQPLPGHPAPTGGGLPSPNNGRPPAASDPGNPCPAGATPHDFDISAVNVPNPTPGHELAFVPTGTGAAAANEPLVLHAAAGECINVTFKNESSNDRASFHVGKLERTPGSSGINVGFNPEQTVGIGQTRQYRFYADTEKIGSAVISDFGGKPVVPDPVTGAVPTDVDTGTHGLYGAFVIAPKGATFSDPTSGNATDAGAQVDVHLPGAEPSGYRDFTLAFAEDDPRIGQDGMPYPTDVAGPALVNYESAPLVSDTGAAFGGNQPTPLLRAYRGDPVKVHAIGAPGSEQMHVFNLGGLSWPIDAYINNSSDMTNLGFGPLESVDAEINGGAGGQSHSIGDFFYGDMRRPFTQAGMWGLFRVSSEPTPTSCTPGGTALEPLPGRDCMGNIDQDAPTLNVDPGAGVFNAPQQVKILSSEPAKIHFTTDGSKPTQRSPLYKAPIPVDKTETIKAIALDSAGNKSGVASWDYTIDNVAPTVSANPKPGTYDRAQQVKLQASEANARIFYTTNGSTPTPQSTELQPGKAIPVSVSSSIKAIAVDPAGNESAVATFAYKIRQPSTVTLNVAGTPLKLGGVRTVAGSVNPSHTGSVKLTVKRSGKMVLVKSLALKSSRFSYPYKPRAAGSYSVSVSFAGDADHNPSTASKSFNVIR